MYEVSDELKKMCLKIGESVFVNYKLTFSDIGLVIDNETLHQESVTLKSAITDGEELEFGGCIASSFEFEVSEIVGTDLKNQKFIAEIQLMDADEIEIEGAIIPIGEFVVDEVRLADTKDYKKVTAYDAMYSANKDVSDWYNSVFPVIEEETTTDAEGNQTVTVKYGTLTLKEFKTSLLDFLGIPYEEQNLENDAMPVAKTINPSDGSLSGQTLLKMIAVAQGGFGKINRDGKFEITTLTHTSKETIYNDSEEYPEYRDLTYEEYICNPITALKISTDDEDVGSVIGTDLSNPYVIAGNYLFYGKTDAELQEIGNNILPKFQVVQYKPINMNIKGIPYLDAGDCILIKNGDAEISTFVLTRELKGIHGILDNYVSWGGEYRKNEVKQSTIIEQLKNKTLKIQKSVDGISVELSDLDKKATSLISQLADEIVLKVDSNGNLVEVGLGVDADNGKTYFKVKSDNISMTAEEAIELIAGGDLNLTGKNITISSDNFNVTSEGNVKIKNGSIYISNNDVYVSINPSKNNIIEVGYGEITDTGNEGEVGSGGVSSENYVETPVYRDMGGLDIYELYGGGFSSNTNYFEAKQRTTEDAILEKNGETYFIERYNEIIKKYNKTKNSWDYVSTVTDGTTPFLFIKTNRDDNNLYICSHKSNNTFSILRFNIDDYTWHTICTITLSSANYLYYIHDMFLDNDTLYVSCYNNSSYSYWYSYTFPNGIEDNQGNLTYTTSTAPSNLWLNKFIPYNNSLYAIMLIGSNYYGSLVKITDLSTLSFKIISNLDQVSTIYYNYNQYCSTIMNDKLYVFCTYVTGSNKYFVCDLKTEDVLEYDGNIKLECNSSYYKTGNLVFNDGEKVHLYNGVHFDRNITYNAYSCTDGAYIAHYVYDGNNTTLVNKNFKELDYGKNFRISSQNDYIVIGDVIYEVECYYTYYDNNTRRYNTNIRRLDTSNSKNDWEIVYTFTTTNDTVLRTIQSNSKDKIYFITGYKNNLWYYDINTKKLVDYYSGKSTDDENFTLGSSIITSGAFGYLDETTMTYYMNRTKIVKVDVTSNTMTSSSITHAAALSNQLFIDGYFYFVGVDNGLKLYKTNIEDGATETLCRLSEISSANDMGFSIFHYNGKIQFFYSYNGVLSHTRYVYNLSDGSLDTFSDVFQDLGFYNVDTAGGYQTCFLPMIPTSTGVHIFVGYPSLTKYLTNGGYKHYVYTEASSDTPTDPDDPTKPPSVDNPTDKIFYISNKGEGYFYGNVYAKDGVFSGDIYARSLTLGKDVSIDTSNISGMDDYLKDYVGNSKIITSDNFSYKTETDENGITKVTSTIDGVTSTTYSSSESNYILTDVGLGGDDSGYYCIISKEGALEATNAVISGQINAGKGYIGGWEIGTNGLKSVGFDEPTTTNGIRLDNNGEIRSKGSWYSSVEGGDVEGWFARLCSGKWIFGYYDSTQTDPFKPPTGTPYSDISVNGVYICSKDTILNKNSQYLFAVDATNDTVSITNSSKHSPALTITNNYYDDTSKYDAPALVLHSPKQGYRNRPLDVRMKVTGEILGTGQAVDNEYCMVMFGEEQYGRIIFRSNKIVATQNEDGTTSYEPQGNTADTESSNPLVPSMLGTSTFRWFQGYFMELYSTNGLNTSSDRKIKNHIKELSPEESLEFCNNLTPVEYTLKNNAHGRLHRGFYAQDVKQVADDMKLGNLSLYAATWDKDGEECYYSEDAPDEELSWTLKYEEFIAPLVGAVQALSKKIDVLENKVNTLENENVELKKEIKELKGVE